VARPGSSIKVCGEAILGQAAALEFPAKFSLEIFRTLMVVSNLTHLPFSLRGSPLVSERALETNLSKVLASL
jgi:hypothetical protein